jgi:hypothetical protein
VANERSLDVAQHEAAHVVVGVALGLRIKRAEIDPPRPGWTKSGGVWFDGRCGTTEAWCIMLAAGVVWEQALHGHARGASGDLAVLRSIYVCTRNRVRPFAVAASALLAGLGPAHARVTRALLERDLTGADITLLAQGERLGDEP